MEEDERGAREIVQLYNEQGKSYYLCHLRQQCKNCNSPSKNDPQAPTNPIQSITKSPMKDSSLQTFECSELEKYHKSDMCEIKPSSSLPSQVTSSDASLIKQPPSSSASSPFHSSILEKLPELHSKPVASDSQIGESHLESTLKVSCPSISSYSNVDQQQEKGIKEKDSTILEPGTPIISSPQKSPPLKQQINNSISHSSDTTTSCCPIVISFASFKTTQAHIKSPSSIVDKDKQNKSQVQKSQLILSTFQDSKFHLSSSFSTSKHATISGTESSTVATSSVLFPENFQQMMQYPPPTYYQSSYYPYMTYAYQHPYYAVQYQQYYGYQYPTTTLPSEQQQLIQQEPSQQVKHTIPQQVKQTIPQQVKQTISQQPTQLPLPQSSYQVQQHQQHWSQQTSHTSHYSNSVTNKSCSLQQYSYQSSFQQQILSSSPSNQSQFKYQKILKSTQPSIVTHSSTKSADSGNSFQSPKTHDVCQYNIELNQQKQGPSRQSTQSTSHSRQPFWQPPSSASSLHQTVEKMYVSTSSKDSSVNDFWQLPIFSTEKGY